jgi:DNA-binding HxlR family transcriptional regulator
MPEKHYQQYCALARALDVAGDRWTLLIVRELAPGPRRFTDLVDGLPGISRKLLTERLRTLERDGILARQELPPPAARQVYELTDDGRDLAHAMAPLIAWGARRLGERKPTESFRARWPAVGMAGLADREAARGVSETYQYVVGRSAFYFTIDDGSIEVHDGRRPDHRRGDLGGHRLRDDQIFVGGRHGCADRRRRPAGCRAPAEDLLAQPDARAGGSDR